MKTLLLSLLLTSSYTFAAPKLVPIAADLNLPVWLTGTKADPNLLYILEKDGFVRILDQKKGAFLKEPFLDLKDRIKVRMNEQGLLCMAFDPNFSSNGRIYVNYTNKKGDTNVSRFTCDPKSPIKAAANSEEILLTITQDHKNHNGGWLAFGPDNLLYLATGDGGSANDPKNRAQDMSSLLGKILRLDVSGAKGYKIPSSNPYLNQSKIKPEIYAHGLRNPWRCDWDPKTNDFYIADVGQTVLEEVNYVPAGKLKGLDFGWRLREGNIKTAKKGVGGERKPTHYEPIYVYKHGLGEKEGLSITGGFVYRGKISSLQGHYLFADFANPRVWSFQTKQNKVANFTDWTETLNLKKHKINNISSFGKDASGELYIIEHKLGSIFKIVE